MKKVLINVTFKDIYTGELHIAGNFENMTEERISEIMLVDKNFITVAGNAEEKSNSTSKTADKKKETKKSNSTFKTADDVPSTESLLDELDGTEELITD